MFFHRPISLLSCLPKLFEKCLLSQPINLASTKNMNLGKQFNRSTSENLTAFGNSEYCSAKFLDVFKDSTASGLKGLNHKIKKDKILQGVPRVRGDVESADLTRRLIFSIPRRFTRNYIPLILNQLMLTYIIILFILYYIHFLASVIFSYFG